MASSHADFTPADLEEITAIAVMGVTGSGKSNFIKHATSSERVRVGHNMQSCTLDLISLILARAVTNPQRYRERRAI